MWALLTVTFGGRGTKDKFTWISFLTKGSTFALFNQRAALHPQKDYIEQVPLVGASLCNALPKHLLWEELSCRWDIKLGLGHLGTLLPTWLKEGARDLDCRATSSYPASGTRDPSNERVLWWHLYLHRLVGGPCPRTPCGVVRQPCVFRDGVTKVGD